MLVIYGDGIAYAEFSTVEDGRRYSSSYTRIKRMIESIRRQSELTGSFDSVFKDKLRQEWVPVTDLFIERWGKELVPHDLRSAIHNVRSNLQLVSPEWPAILLLKDDGLLAEPSNVDHLGRVVVGSGM
jgi:hypothetical protein